MIVYCIQYIQMSTKKYMQKCFAKAIGSNLTWLSAAYSRQGSQIYFSSHASSVNPLARYTIHSRIFGQVFPRFPNQTRYFLTNAC